MDNTIKKLLGEGTLPREIEVSLQEAFNTKVEEMREEIERSVRAEISARYEHDKSNLVEAMDKMLTDHLTQHVTALSEEKSRFVEAREVFRKSVKEARGKYNTKLRESVSTSKKFVLEQLSKEIGKLRIQQKKLVSERLNTAAKLEAIKENMAAEQATRLKKIDEFVIRQVGRELKEFEQDQRALNETRVRLIREGRDKLKTTQKRFVSEATRKINEMVTKQLKSEMTELREDIETNRKNMFGRRIFETFAAEYMTSYLQEGSEVRKLQNVLESTENNVADLKKKLAEANSMIEASARKVKLVEDRAVRTKILTELLSNLKGEKRRVMESLLETTATPALREHFNKMLPIVLDETRSKPNAVHQKKALSEATRFEKPSTLVAGGNVRAGRLVESNKEESGFVSDEMAHLVRLSGITK